MKIRSLGIMLMIILSSFEIFSQLDATFTSPSSSQCPENLFTLNATNTTYGNSNYSWIITGPSFSQTYTGSSIAAYLTISGFYNVSLTVSNGVTTTTNTQNNFIQVYSKPSIAYSVLPTTGCSPLLVSFNGSCTPGSGTLASFSSIVDGTSYTNEDFSHTFSSGGSYTPTITVTNSFGCFTTSNLTIVNVTSSPSITSPLNPNQICSGSIFNYSPTSSIPGATYSWVRTLPPGVTGSGSNSSTGTTGQISQTLTNNTSNNLQVVYSMTVTANGCSSTQNVVVTVRALPTVSINQGSNLAICSGQTGTLTAVGSPSGGSYSWTSGANTSSISVSSAGVQSITYSDGTCSSLAATSTVSITSAPTISSFTRTENSGTANDGSICPGSSAIISATVSAPGGTYLWSNGATTSTISVSPPITSTYSLTYTLGCATNNSTQIVVLGLPIPSYTTGVSNFCSPPITTTFTNTSTNASGGITWSFQGGTPSSSTINIPSVTYNTSGNFSVTLTATSASGCSRTIIFPNAITIGSGVPPSSLYNATTPLIQCYSSIAAPANSVANNSVCFEYIGVGADTLQWNWGDGSALEYSDELGTQCHTYASVGTYTVIATPYTTVGNQLGCAGASTSFTVTINGPVASYSLSAIDCNNQTTRTFTSTSTGTSVGASYAWDFGDPASGANNTSTLQTVSHTFSQTQSAAYLVKLTVTDPSSGCPASAITTSIFAYPNNTAAFQSYNNTTVNRVVTTEVCLNGSLSFYNETPAPQLATVAAHTVWNFNNTNPAWSTVSSVRGNPNTYNFLETGVVSNFNVSWVPGIYDVSMRNRRDNPDVNNQCFQILTKNNYIKVHGVIGTFVVADTVCANTSISLTDNSSAPVSSIASRIWNWGDGTPNTTGNISNPSHTYSTAGNFTISLTVTDAFGCTKTTTKQINVRKPFASFSVDRNFICQGQSVSVTDNSIGQGLNSYNWTAPNANNPSASGINPSPFSFPNQGISLITLVVTDNSGCFDDTTISITVQNPIPSATASPSLVSCFNPPTTVSFTNTSSNNVDNSSAVWNFNATNINSGTGTNPLTSNIWQPSVSYSLPGTYIVTLQVNSLSGCSSSAQQVATVTIGGPSGSVNVTNTNLTGCSCYTANMTVTTANVTDAKLLYGDGQFIDLIPNTTQNITYSYCNSGITTISRIPSLYVSNGTCNGFIPATDTIYIKPTPTISPISDQLKCAGVNSDPVVFSSNILGTTYTWSNTNTTTGLSSSSGSGNIVSFLTDNTNSTPINSTITVTPLFDGCPGSPTNFTITVDPRPSSTISSSVVCVGGTVTLTPNVGGIWSSSNPIAASVSGSGIVSIGTPASTQTTTLTFTETITGCFRDHLLTVNPRPIVNASTSVCVGGTINLSPNSGGTWISNPISGSANIVPSTGVVTGVSPGLVNFTYTDNVTGCSNTTSNVLVNALPIVTLSPVSICQGQGSSVSPTTGGSWTVLTGNGVSITNGGVITTTNVASGPASFEFTQTSTGCKATTVNLNINPLPSITSPTAICIGSTGSLTPSTGGTWTSSNTAVATVSNVGLITPVSPGTVTFTYTLTSTGCSRTTSIVTINSLPILTSPSSICVGSTANLTPVNGGTWTSNNNNIATVTNAGIVTAVAAGNAVFTFTNSTTLCSSSSSIVTINALPVISATSTSICVGGTTILTPTTGGTWTSNTGSIASIDNAGLVTGISNGSTTMIFTNSTTSCSNSSAVITVNSLPIFGTSKTDPTFCNATNGTVTLTGLTANTNYQYTYTLNGVTTGPTSSQSNNLGQIVVSNLGAGTYTFTIQLTSSGCNSLSQNVSLVNPNAPDLNDISDQFICGASYTLPIITGTNLPGNQIYSTAPNGGGIILPVGSVINSTQTIYLWTQTPTTGGCSDQESFVVTISSNPVITAPTTVCVGSTGILTPNTNVTWSSSNTNRATVSNSGVITGLSAGNVTFTVLDNNTQCSSSVVVQIIARPIVNASSFVCVNGTINITPSTGGIWTSSNSNLATISNNGLVTGMAPGTVQFTFTNSTTTCSNTTSIVTVRPQPILTSPSSLCMGDVGLLSPTVGGTWTTLAAATATVNNAGIITPVAPGNVTFSFLETSSGCSDTTLNVVINSLPVLAGPSQVCIGSNINLSPSAGGNWSGGNSVIATISPLGVVTGESLGSTSFTFTSSSTGCTNTSSLITVNPNPILNGPSEVCVGSTINYTGGTGFSWSSNDPAIITVQPSGLVTGVSAGSTYLINTNPFTGCFANSAPITVNSLPTLTSQTSVCVGSNFTLTPTNGGIWSSSNTSIATVSSAGVVEGVTVGSAIFTYTDASTNCSNLTSSVSIIANPVITLSRTNPTICNGSNGTITINGLTPNTTFEYTYTSSSTGLVGPISAVSNAAGRIIISGLLAGTYSVSVMNPTTSCFSSQVNITLTNPNAPNIFDIADQTLCGGSYTLPQITGTNLSNPEYWTSGGGTGSVITVGTTISTIGVTTIYIYSATPGGCFDEESFTVTINPIPVVSAPTSVCQGLTTLLSPTSGGTWSVTTGASFASVQNDGTVLGILPGSSSFTFTESGTNCSNTTTSLSIIALPTVNAGPSQTVCSNSIVTLSGSIGGSATISNWSGGTGVILNPTSLTTSYSIGSGDFNTATFTLTGVDPTGVCPDVTDQIVVTIDQAPVVSAGLSQIICSNSTVSLSGTLGGTASNAIWSVTAGGLAGNFSDVNSLNATYTPSADNILNGFVTLTLTSSDPIGPCTAVSDNVSITINPVATVSAGADFVSCSGSAIQLPGVIGGSATAATWSGDGGGIYTLNASGVSGTYMPTNQEFLNNSVTLTLTTNDPIGPCTSQSASVTVTFANPATVTAVADLTICEGQSANLSGNFGGSASSASWVYVSNNGSFQGIISPNINSSVITYQPSPTDIINGFAKLIYRTNDPAGPCGFVDDTVTITINPTPVLTNQTSVTVCEGDPLNVQFTINSGLNANYSWFATDNSNVSGESVGIQTTNLISDILVTNGVSMLNETVQYTITPSIQTTGCIGVPLQLIVTVIPRPTISNVNDQLLCSNTSTQLTNWQSNTINAIFNWTYTNFDTNPNNQTNIGGINSSGLGQIPSFVATNNSLITQLAIIEVTPTNFGCAGTPDTLIFTVLPVATVVDPIDQVLCANLPTAPVIFVGSHSNTVYNWSSSTIPLGSSIGLGINGNLDIPSFIGQNSGTSDIVSTITVTPSLNGCLGIQQTFTITIKPVPVLQQIADRTLCIGNQSTIITFTGPPSGTSFVWTNSLSVIGLAASGTTNFIPSFIATHSTGSTINQVDTALIQVTPTFGGCSGTPINFTIFVNPILKADSLPDFVLCEGDTFPLITITGNAPNVFYTWTSNNNSIGLGNSGQVVIPDFVATAGNVNTTATVIITPNLANCQGVTDTFLITIRPKPNVIIDLLNQGNCHNVATQPVNFTSNVAGTSYTWINATNVSIHPPLFPNTGFGNLPSFLGQNTFVPAVSQTANYYVIPSSNGCLGDTGQFTITVDPKPTVNPELDQTICSGNSTTQIVFSGNFANGTVYNWNSNSQSVFPTTFTFPSTDFIPAFIANNSSSVTINSRVIVTPVYGYCIGDNDTLFINVKPKPTVYQVTNQSLCVGDLTQAINFGGNMDLIPSDGPATYTWSNSDNTIGLANDGVGNILPFVAGNNGNSIIISTITVVPEINNCIGDPMTFTISTVDPIPIVTPIPNQIWCEGDATNSILFQTTFSNIQSMTTFQWSNDNPIGLASSGIANSSNGFGIPSFTTNVSQSLIPVVSTFDVVPNYSGCAGDTISFTITVKPIPNVFITPQTQQVCTNNSTQAILFTGNIVGTDFNWTATAGAIGSGSNGIGNIPSFTALNGGNNNIVDSIFVQPSLNGCFGPVDTALIIVNPISTVNISIDTFRYCHGEIVPQNCFFGNNISTIYLWSNSNTAIGLPSSGSGCIPSFSITNTNLLNDTANIIIQPILNGCSGTPDTFLIITKPIPNVYSVSDVNICAGVTVPTITFQGDMTSETDFVWSGNTIIGLNPNNGIDSIPTFSGVNTSQIILIDTILITPERQGCIGLNDTLLISVNPISTVTVNNITVCNGVPIPPLPINGPNSVAIYAWTNNNTSIGLIAADTSFTAPHSFPSFTAVGGIVPQIAEVVVTPLVNGCPGINDTMTITVNPTPIVNPVPSQSLCAGTTSNPITFSGPVANTTFNWSHNNASTGLVPTSGIGDIPPFTGGPNLYPSLDNIASVTVTPVANGCSGIPINFSITVHPLPIINAGFDTTLCLGQFIIPQASGNSIAGNSFGFQWTATPSNASNITPLTGIPYYPDATTTLSVIGTDANLCQNVDTLIVTYLQVPPPQVFAGIDTALCFGESITLTAVHDADLLVWDNDINDGVEFTPDTTLSYIATASNVNGCYSKDTIVVTVNPLPIITANALDDFICDGDSTILWGDGAGVGSVYTWNNSVVDSVGFIPLVTNTYTVIGTDVNGCRDTANIVVTVNPNPVVLFSSNITFGGCLPFAPVFTDLSSPASGSVTWDFGDGNTSNQLGNVVNIYDNFGCYDVTLTSTTPEGCSSTFSQQDFVCVNQIIADFYPNYFVQPISNPSFEFENTSQNATSFQWFFGDGDSSYAVHPNHTYDEIGYYPVVLVASAQDGCTDTAVIVITVRDEVILYVPNSFTPDNNGLNDNFIPILTAGYQRGEGWQLNIYDRWGELVFNSEVVGNGWDGTYLGEPAQIGTYIWTLRFKDSQNNKIYDYTGHVNLIR